MQHHACTGVKPSKEEHIGVRQFMHEARAGGRWEVWQHHAPQTAHLQGRAPDPPLAQRAVRAQRQQQRPWHLPVLVLPQPLLTPRRLAQPQPVLLLLPLLPLLRPPEVPALAAAA